MDESATDEMGALDTRVLEESAYALLQIHLVGLHHIGTGRAKHPGSSLQSSQDSGLRQLRSHPNERVDPTRIRGEDQGAGAAEDPLPLVDPPQRY
jgi:hypothetical protein